MIEIHIRHAQASPHTGKLTGEGVRQAQLAGQYIRDSFPRTFEHGFHSSSSRAIQTAELLSLPSTTWHTRNELAEKQAGEGWDEVLGRARSVMQELDNAYTGMNRILVYHGDTMHAMRAQRENFLGMRFALLFEAPYKYFNNTQLIIYTDEAPHGYDKRPATWWVKSVCPWTDATFGHDWIEFDKNMT